MKYVEKEIGLEVDLVKDENGKYIPFEWRDVLGYKGYYKVSNYGHVKTIPRRVNCKGGTRLIKSRLKSQHPVGSYYQVQLSRDGKHISRNVHYVVYESFKGLISTGKCIDHADRNSLNNTVWNLREVTRSHNSMNRGSVSNTSSKYKGVHKHTNHWKWRVCSREPRGTVHIGYFALEGEAAQAYNEYIVKERGEDLAVLNDLSNHDWEEDKRQSELRRKKNSKRLMSREETRDQEIKE